MASQSEPIKPRSVPADKNAIKERDAEIPVYIHNVYSRSPNGTTSSDFPSTQPPGEPSAPLSMTDFLGDELCDKSESVKFRWFHIPVNDTALIEGCIDRIYRSNGTHDKTTGKQLEESWVHNVRPAGSLPKNILPQHSLFMEPSCEVYSLDKDGESSGQDEPREAVSIFLPYLNWETYKAVQKLHHEEGGGQGPNDSPPGFHQRRTLDQFYYTGLWDTSTRDAGQTVSKWTEDDEQNEMSRNGRRKAGPTSLVVMVDQLWLWILDNKSVLSFFPLGTNSRFTDLYTSTKDQLQQFEDVYDLAALLMKQSITGIFEHENKKVADLLGIYQWAIGNKAARQTENFEAFSLNQSGLGSTAPSLSNDAPELKLALEVADILDELNMLAVLLEMQHEVLASLNKVLLKVKPKTTLPPHQNQRVEFKAKQGKAADIYMTFAPETRYSIDLEQEDYGTINLQSQGAAASSMSGIAGHAGKAIEQAEQELRRAVDGVKRLKADTKNTHRMILDLLDLKQKAASLEEARSSRKQADETARQGNSIMVFTIVTIIFLPLSFMAAFFAINIAEFPKESDGLHLDYVSKYMFSISAAIVVPLVVLAFKVNEASEAFSKWAKWIVANSMFPNPVEKRGKHGKNETLGNSGTESGVKSHIPNRNPKTDEQAKGTRPTASDAIAAAPNKPTDQQRQHLLVSFLSYCFVILPLKELQFALRLAGSIKKSITSALGPAQTQDEKTQDQRNCRDNSDGTPAHRSLTNAKTISNATGENTIPWQHWQLRPGVRDSVFAIFAILRLCIIPVWVVVLFVDLILLLVLYSIVSLLFQNSPLYEIKQRLPIASERYFSAGSRGHLGPGSDDLERGTSWNAL